VGFGGDKFVTIISMVQNHYKYDSDVICKNIHKHIASFLSPINFFCAIRSISIRVFLVILESTILK
jgi:hypothetical protein